MLSERRAGSANGGMLKKFWTGKDKSNVELLFVGKMETRIRNFGEMWTKMLAK